MFNIVIYPAKLTIKCQLRKERYFQAAKFKTFPSITTFSRKWSNLLVALLINKEKGREEIQEFLGRMMGKRKQWMITVWQTERTTNSDFTVPLEF